MIHSILFTRGSGDLIKDGSRQPSCPVKSVVGEEWGTLRCARRRRARRRKLGPLQVEVVVEVRGLAGDELAARRRDRGLAQWIRRRAGRGLYIWEQRRVLAVHLHGVGTEINALRGQAGKSSWSTFPRLPLSWRLSGCLALLVSRLISPLASRSRRCLRLKWLNETARYIKRRARRW